MMLNPQLASWDMKSIPAQTFRLRWKLFLDDGTEKLSAWTPGDYPSFTLTREEVHARAKTFVVEAENSTSSVTTNLLELPYGELQKLEYVGMLSSSTNANTVGALKVTTAEQQIFVFINGFIHIEDLGAKA